MRSRNQLHLTKLDEFAEFCESKGYVRETPIADAYEVLRLRRRGSPAVIAHKRDCATQHATLHGQGQREFDRWLADRAKRAYAEINPLGGPAKVFEAVASRIRAGENLADVMDDYGLAWTTDDKRGDK